PFLAILHCRSLLRPLFINLRRLGLVPLKGFLFGGGLVEGANDAEAEEEGVGKIPDALGKLRILLLPVGGGGDAGGTASTAGAVVPGAAAGDSLLFFLRKHKRGF